MADNVSVTEGSGKTIATDDVSGVQYQRVKLDVGGDGATTPVTSTGLPVNDAGGSLTVDGGVSASGDVAHDAADSGNPVKVGAKAVSAFPAAVTANDRANLLADLVGRILTGRRPLLTQKSLHVQYTAQQTGTAVWTPASGKRIVIESVVVSGYGSTAGHVNLWFGASGDTTYSIGTDQPLWNGRVLPSAVGNQAPHLPFTPGEPVECLNADYDLKITTDAAVSVHVTVHGYEIV